MYFNVNGRSHSMRLRVVDHCGENVLVYEALVDGGASFFFEAPENEEIWTLFGTAIAAYVEYRGTDEMIVSNWEVKP
jgi:hypothetical protein